MIYLFSAALDFFKEEPIPFCDLARELLPGNFRSTPTHKFIKLLQDKGVRLSVSLAPLVMAC